MSKDPNTPKSPREPEVTPGGRVLYDPISVWESAAAKKHREYLPEVERHLPSHRPTDDRD